MKCVLCGEEEALPGWDVCSMCDYRMAQRDNERRMEEAMEKEMHEAWERDFWDRMMKFDELESLSFPDRLLIYE